MLSCGDMKAKGVANLLKISCLKFSSNSPPSSNYFSLPNYLKTKYELIHVVFISVIISVVVKFVLYLLSSNIGEVLLIFISIIIGLPLPLLALQLLWINLVTDGLPALALSVDPIEKGVMNKKPRKKNDYIINKRRIALISLIGIVFAAGIILLYKSSLNKGYAYATTVAFAAVLVYEMFNVFNFRSEGNSILKEGLFGNNYLILAIMSSILLQLIVIYTPLNNIFKITYLDFQMWIIIAMSASSILLAVEIFKAASKKMKIIQ